MSTSNVPQADSNNYINVLLFFAGASMLTLTTGESFWLLSILQVAGIFFVILGAGLFLTGTLAASDDVPWGAQEPAGQSYPFGATLIVTAMVFAVVSAFKGTSVFIGSPWGAPAFGSVIDVLIFFIVALIGAQLMVHGQRKLIITSTFAS